LCVTGGRSVIATTTMTGSANVGWSCAQDLLRKQATVQQVVQLRCEVSVPLAVAGVSGGEKEKQ